MAEDFYQVLGLDKDADTEHIKQAYRSEVKKCHPDASGSGSSAGRFRAVEQAYETLRDSRKREAYDRELGRRGPRAFRAAGDSRAGFSSRGWDSSRGWGSSLFDFPGLSGRRQPPEPVLEILLSPEEARWGVSVPVELPVGLRCPECGDFGPWARLMCTSCGGSGTVYSAGRITLRIPPGVPGGAEFRCTLAPGAASSFRVRVLVETP